jgi:septal ring factor EnvC (AmiA/AmiB activator)
MFSRGPVIVLFALVIVAGLFVFSGVISIRTADTHNTTVAIQEYNTWVTEQKQFDHEVRSDLQRISTDTTMYNTEIAGNATDLATLRQNVADEQQLVNAWEGELTRLNFATDGFEKNTSALTYGNNPKTQQEVALMVQYMRIYTVSMGNAQQHLIDYTNNAGLYVSTDDPDYWNAAYLQSAMSARQLAVSSLSDGDAALENITAQAQLLQQSQ